MARGGGYRPPTAAGTARSLLPFLVGCPAELYHALVGTSLREKEYWTLPFPWTYDAASSGLRDGKDVLDYYVPALLLVACAMIVVAVVLRLRSDRRHSPLMAGLVAYGVGGLAYLLSRTDEFHSRTAVRRRGDRACRSSRRVSGEHRLPAGSR